MLGIPVMKLAVIGGVGVVAAIALASNGHGAGASPSQAQCKFQVNADVLNIRSGPGTDNVVVGHYRQGAAVTADNTVKGGFRRIDDTHWVSGDYLVAASGNTC